MDSNFVLICSQIFILCCLFLKIPKHHQKNQKSKPKRPPKSHQTIERELCVATFYNTTCREQPGVENPCTRSITDFLRSYWLCKSLWEYHQFLATSTSLFIWIDPNTARMTQFACCAKLQNKIFSLKRGKNNEKRKEAGPRLCPSYLLLRVGKYPCLVAPGNFSVAGIGLWLSGSSSAMHSMQCLICCLLKYFPVAVSGWSSFSIDQTLYHILGKQSKRYPH